MVYLLLRLAFQMYVLTSASAELLPGRSQVTPRAPSLWASGARTPRRQSNAPARPPVTPKAARPNPGRSRREVGGDGVGAGRRAGTWAEALHLQPPVVDAGDEGRQVGQAGAAGRLQQELALIAALHMQPHHGGAEAGAGSGAALRWERRRPLVPLHRPPLTATAPRPWIPAAGRKRGETGGERRRPALHWPPWGGSTARPSQPPEHPPEPPAALSPTRRRPRPPAPAALPLPALPLPSSEPLKGPAPSLPAAAAGKRVAGRCPRYKEREKKANVS